MTIMIIRFSPAVIPGTTFGTEKLEWFGYVPTVKKFEDTITRFDRIHERDRRTERQRYRHRMTAPRLQHRAAKNRSGILKICTVSTKTKPEKFFSIILIWRTCS